MAERKSCKFAGFEYAHDTRMCKTRKCVRCNDGVWQETGGNCPC